MTDEQQLQKDIIQYIDPLLLPEVDLNIFRQKLAAKINLLINNDFNSLIHILYRLDINEKKLRELLATEPASDAGELIAAMIIERQLQKIKLRRQFKQDDKNIPEEDKW